MVALVERGPVEEITFAPESAKFESVEIWTLYLPTTLAHELINRVIEFVLITVTERSGSTGNVTVEKTGV